MSGESKTIWQRLSQARRGMRIEKKGSMRIGGNKIEYATIDDLYATINNALSEQGLWLNTPLSDNLVHIRVIDVNDGEALELLSYPCVLTGRDVKADAGMWTSCKRYALTSAFNLASGDESGAEQTAARGEERRSLGFARQSRFTSVPESKVTMIRALLVQSGIEDPLEQRGKVEAIIGRKIERLDGLRSNAEADRIIEELTPSDAEPQA